MDWTRIVWRLLCLLTLITACAAVSGLFWWLPAVWQAVAVLPGLLVTLCVAVASYADSMQPSVEG